MQCISKSFLLIQNNSKKIKTFIHRSEMGRHYYRDVDCSIQQRLVEVGDIDGKDCRIVDIPFVVLVQVGYAELLCHCTIF